MIRFAHPDLLNLLWLLPVLLLLVWIEYKWRLKSMRNWATERMWNAALPHSAPDRLVIRRLLQVLTMGFLVAAISGPQVGTRLVEVKREGTDLVVAVDVSTSMMAEDIAPSRLVKARHEITRLLGRLRGDRVALTPFAGVAFVQVPLTLDYAAVVSVLDALEPGLIPQPGSSLAAAIRQSRRAFKTKSDAQKVLVLISDGEDHEEGAVEEARLAADEGIVIYTVGMATVQGSPIPNKDSRGNTRGYKQDREGNTIVSRLNSDLLKQIAGITGGEYHMASNTGVGFEEIYKKMMGMDKGQFETKEFTDYEDRFQWFAAAALLMLIISELIPTVRRRKS